MNKQRTFAAGFCVGIALLLLPQPSSAQAVYGSVYGTVTDKTGAAIPNATVTVSDEAKGTTFTVQSNGSGEFSVEHLIPDPYDIKVSANGFQTYETQHLQVFADASPKVDARLTTGGASETVRVDADQIPELKTDRADVSTIFDNQTVNDLPVPNRNFTSLQLLLPGAQQLGWSHAASENPQGSQQIQIDGQAFGGVAYELDGTDNQDPILGIIVVNPALDAVTEAKITTQNFDAEFGKAIASVVTAQTKSGSNAIHGSVFDYRQSDANRARDPFSQFSPDVVTKKTIPAALYSQFGGSLGGPIVKDKAFIFGDYQGVRQKVGISNIVTVPSPHLIATCLGMESTASGIPGCDFSEYANSGLVPTGTPLIYQQDGTPYPGQVIPTSQLAPQALNLLKLLQPFKPNKSGQYGLLSAGNFATGGTGLFNNDQWDVRLDVQASQRTHAFGRFSRFTDTLTGGTTFGAAGGPGFGIAGFGGTSLGANDSLATGADVALTNNLLTDFRLGYYRYGINTSKYDQKVAFADQLGIPGANLGTNFTSGAPAFSIQDVGSYGGGGGGGAQYGSGLNINRCNCPLVEHEDQFQIVNNWTKIKGNHSIKVGVDLRYARNLRVPSDSNRAGEFNFGTSQTSNPAASGNQGGLGFASFVLGDVASFSRYVSTSTNAKEFQKREFFYGQDTWRVSSALTMNIGLRYELYFPEVVNARGNGSLLDINTGYLHVAGIGGVPTNMGWRPALKAFAPRVGVAYQINPRTVIRSGYGRSFDLGIFGSIYGHVATQNLPVLARQQTNATNGPLSSAFNLASGPPPPPVTVVPASGLLPAPGYQISPQARPNPLRLPTIDAWNLSIQHSITPTLSLTLAYVGNKGSHTLGAGDNNNINPNEPAIALPAAFSVNGQGLHYDSTVPADGSGIAADGGTANTTLLRRYYGGTKPACSDPAYVTPSGVSRGQCGWTNDVTYYSESLDTHFNSLQVTVAKQMSKGLSFTSNYAWQRGFDWAGGFSTWDKRAVKGRNNDIREQQEVFYATWELPFGRKHHFASNIPVVLDEVIGGWELSPILNWSSGLPFTLSYNECGTVIPYDAPCYPNGRGSMLKTHLGKYNPIDHNRLFYHGAVQPLDVQPFSGFNAPGLDQIGNSGRNNVFGPSFFNTDLSIQKNFPIHESLFAQFRVDAYNVFNHINSNFGGGGWGASIDSGDVFVNSVAPSQFPTRQLQFSMRVQF